MFNEVQIVLDPEEMSNELEQLLLNKYDTKKALKDKSDEFLILAKLAAVNYKMPNKNEVAKSYFNSSIKADSNLNNLLDFGEFLVKIGHHKDAINIYSRYLGLIKEVQATDNNYDQFKAHINLMSSYISEKKYLKGEEIFEKAMELYNKFSSTDAKKHIIELSMLFTNYSSICLSLPGRINEAEEILNKNIKLLDKIMEESSDEEVRFSMIGSLNNLGVLMKANKKYYIAERAYEIALNLFSSLTTDSFDYVSNLAMTYQNFGNLKFTTKEFLDSEYYFEEGTKLYEILATVEPYKYNSDLSSIYNSLGNSQTSLKKIDKAKASLKFSLKIGKELMCREPEIYSIRVTKVLTSIGLLYFTNEEYTLAINYFEDALKIHKNLDQNDFELRLDNVRIRYNLSQTFAARNMLNKATESMKEAINMLKPICEKSPQYKEFLDHAIYLTNKWKNR